jgi:hypothetical protein
MKLKEIINHYKQVAPIRKKGVVIHKTKKADLIRMIQVEEGNNQCFKNGINNCGLKHCLWYKDCQK